MCSCTLSVKNGHVGLYGDDSIRQDKGVICSSDPCQRLIPYSVLWPLSRTCVSLRVTTWCIANICVTHSTWYSKKKTFTGGRKLHNHGEKWPGSGSVQVRILVCCISWHIGTPDSLVWCVLGCLLQWLSDLLWSCDHFSQPNLVGVLVHWEHRGASCRAGGWHHFL